MELTLTKAFIVALLGLGNIVPSACSAITDLSQPRYDPSSDLVYETRELFRRVPVPGRGGDSGGESGAGEESGEGGGSGEGSGSGDGGGDSDPAGDGNGAASGANPSGFEGSSTSGTSNVLNIETKRYVAWKDSERSGVQEYTIWSGAKGSGTSLGTIRVDKNEKSIATEDVDFKADPQSPRLGLFQAEASLWVYSAKMAPQDLEKIHALSVDNEETTEIVLAYQKDKSGDAKYPTVTQSSTDDELKLFNDIMAAPLGNSAKRTFATLGITKEIHTIEITTGTGSYGDDFSLTWSLQ